MRPGLPSATRHASRISAAFSASPALQGSEASIVESRGTRYYVNSEHFKVIAPVQSASLRVVADTQAGDGALRTAVVPTRHRTSGADRSHALDAELRHRGHHVVEPALCERDRE